MKRTVSRSVLLLALLSLWAIPAAAAQKKAQPKKSGARISSAPVAVGPECPADGSGQPGLRAFLDPETGQLREGTPEERRALSNRARAEASNVVESPEIAVYPDGMVVVDLKGNFMQSIVMTRNADGTLSTRCESEAEKSAAPKPPRAPAHEER